MFTSLRAQRRLYIHALWISFALIAASFSSLLFAHHIFPMGPSFMVALVSATGVLDVLSALLLYELYHIEGRSIFFGAACAYFIDALLVWAYGLTFPGFFATAQSSSNDQTAAWIWLSWHVLFPIPIAIGALHKSVEQDDRQRFMNAGLAIIGITAVAAVSTIIVITQRNVLPLAVQNSVHTSLYQITASASAIVNVLTLAVLLFFSQAPAKVRIWLAVAVLASALDAALNAANPQPFSIPWYMGTFEMMVTASVLFAALMRMWITLYATSISLTRNLRATISERRRLQKRFDREHTIAAELQQASLPRTLPTFNDTHLSAVYRPAVLDLEIGGDWYDAFALEDGRLVLTIGDVTGKGLAASLIMGKVRQMLRIAACTDPDPARMLNITDRALRIEHADTIVTAFAAIIDRRQGTLLWASAGHPPSFLRTAAGTILTLESSSLPLGLRENDPPSHLERLDSGCMLVAYTDGLVEAQRDIIDGCRRVKDALLDPAVYGASYPAQLLHDRVVGKNGRDDIAIVTVKYTPIRARLDAISWTADSGDQLEVSKIRNAICQRLRAHRVSEERIFNIELAFGELVGNVERYAPGAFEGLLEIDVAEATLTIIDHGDGFAYFPPACADPLAESGRGLFLIATLCKALEIAAADPHGTMARATFATDGADLLFANIPR